MSRARVIARFRIRSGVCVRCSVNAWVSLRIRAMFRDRIRLVANLRFLCSAWAMSRASVRARVRIRVRIIFSVGLGLVLELGIGLGLVLHQCYIRVRLVLEILLVLG